MARNGKKTKYKKITFDSQSECDFYKLLEKAKKEKRIKDFKHEPEYVLQEGGWENKRGEKQSPILYYPDFLITPIKGEDFIIDTKGGLHEDSAVIKKKILEYKLPITIYFISKLPIYLGGSADGVWVETTPNHDMEKKLRRVYKDKYPHIKRKTKATPKLTVKDWEEYMEFENVCGLFYTCKKYYTKKERENS